MISGLPTLPPVENGIRLLQVEPRRWWLIGAGERADDIAARIADSGAATPVGGGLVRATLSGPGWRTLLMVSGCFDAEDPSFGIGQVAANDDPSHTRLDRGDRRHGM